ncbi:hypothetical protein KFE25_013071 [Diacronema lutheri]|uniref:Uncharacterized protein n=1 Tax=Diacronema lutheri TaxID=2081491 RepID=A0A8J5XA77_DIALT|nr:hypothetical protein KFE25_013071 [Diacronema lutheri]
MQPTLVRLKTGEIAVRVPEPAPTEAVASPRPRKTKRTPSGRPKVPPPPAPTASAEELADFEKHVWHGCFLCVIYLPRNMKRCQETIENVVGHGFPPPFMMPGVTPRPGDTVHDCVCRAHHTAISWYLAKGLDSRYHMFVLEDDAQFVFDDAAERVKVALDSLETWGKWGSLHIGHIPMGPIYPLPNGLARSMNPCTSHAYVLNRRTVRSIHAFVPERLWKRPMMVEGHWAYPADERFAMLPTVATQSVMPKEMASIPIVRSVCSLQSGERCATCFAFFQTLSAICLSAWLLLVAVRWPLSVLRRAELQADGDNAPPCKLVPHALSITLAAWLTVTVLVLHTCYYAARRFTCAFAERRHWRTFLLDTARTALGLAVAAAFEFGYVLHVQPSVSTLRHGDELGIDALSRAASALLVVPVFVWPLALALHAAVADRAGQHRRLQAIAVSGRYSDPLSFLPSAGIGFDAEEQAMLNRALASIVRPPSLLPMPSFRLKPQAQTTSLLASRSVNGSCVSLDALDASASGALVPLSRRDRTASTGALSAHSEAFTTDGDGAGDSAREALRALEEAVAAADSPERLQAQPARLSWWLAQAVLWTVAVSFSELCVLGACQLLGSNGPVELAAIAIARLLPWSCTAKEVGLCALGRLVVLLLATTLVDAQLRCAHLQHQSELVRARAYDELGGHISRASSHVDMAGLTRSAQPSPGRPGAPRDGADLTPTSARRFDGRRGAQEMV